MASQLLESLGQGAAALNPLGGSFEPIAAREFAGGAARGTLKTVTDFTAGGFDLAGAEEVAEGIRASRTAAFEKLGISPDEESGYDAVGELFGTMITTLAPFMGAAKAANIVTKASPKVAQLLAEGVSGAPLAAALATDPELSFFQDMPEEARVALEAGLETVAGAAAASLPLFATVSRAADDLAEQAARGVDDVSRAVKEPPGLAELRRAEEAGEIRVVANEIDQNILKHHQTKLGGTFDPQTGESLTKKNNDVWAVGTQEKYSQLLDHPPTAEDIARYRRAHAKELRENPNLVIGTWDDTRDNIAHGKHELTLTELFDNEDDAITAARKRGEKAIVNLADPGLRRSTVPKAAFIPVDDAVARAERRAFLDDKVPVRRERRAQEFVSFLTPEQAQRFEDLPQAVQEQTLRNFSLMPSSQELASAAIVGGEAMHWYDTSSRSLHHMFEDDTPRFTALLAAMSPQVEVEDNLKSTLRLWKKWTDAGRPTDAKEIKRLVRETSRELQPGAVDDLFGIKEGKKFQLVPSAVENNAVTVLGRLTERELLDPRLLAASEGILSGPKVDAFYSNLMGNVQRVTIDTHMLRGFGANTQSVTANRLLGTSAGVTRTAEYLSQVLGREVTPPEVQAMTWAFFKAVSDRLEGVRRTKNPLDVLEDTIFEGGPARALAKDIRDTPSFASLIHREDIAALAQEAGAKLPPVLPTSGLDVSLDMAREADLVEIAQRMKASNEGNFLFGIAALLAGAAAEQEQSGAGAAGGALAAGAFIGRPAGRSLRRAARIAERAAVKVGAQTKDAARVVDQLKSRGHRLLSAFQDPDTGEVILTGAFHDINAVADPVQRRVIEETYGERGFDPAGFYDAVNDRYLTREQAAELIDAPAGESSLVRSAERARGYAEASPLDDVISQLEAFERGPIRDDLLFRAREIKIGGSRAEPNAFLARLQKFADRNPGLNVQRILDEGL